jgi:hypothetical protein
LKGSLLQLDREIEELKLEVEVLGNYSKYTNFVKEKKKKNFELIGNSTDNSFSSAISGKLAKRRSEKEAFDLMIFESQKAEELREIEKNMKSIQLIEKIMLKDNLHKRLGEIRANLTKDRTDLSVLLNELIIHYHKLLAIGKDTR